MATRRSRLQIKPNLGPKLGKLTPARPKPSSPTVTSAEENVTKDNPNENENTEASLTVIKTPKSQPTIEPVLKPSPLKSPNQSENNVGKALYKPDSSVIRGFRNRLPKAKPNITPRGASRQTPNKLPSAKTGPVEKTVIYNDQPDSANTAQDNKKKSTGDTVFKPVNTVPVVQDENRPVSNHNDDTCSVFSETVSETTCNREQSRERRLSGSPGKAEKPPKKRRNFTHRKFPENEPPDRQKMKMSDMIYWNPSNNPMKQATKTKKIVDTSKNDLVSPIKSPTITKDIPVDTSVSSPVKEADETSNDSMPVPQVTIGPDGSMIINERSLVIETEKDTTNEKTSQYEVSVEDDDMFVNYNSFRNKGPTKSWFDNETARFYRALSCLGTDFSLMSSLFPHRCRRELKNKFKREEKYNRNLVDAAIRDRTPLNLDSFESIESVLEKDKQDREQKRKKNLKRKRSEKRTETSELKEKRQKENKEEGETPSPPKASPKKKKSPRKSKIGKTKSKRGETRAGKRKDSEKAAVKPVNKVPDQEGFSEYEFEDETEPLPARLPKLKKSPQFKEFRNTAARKLRSSQSQPVSEEDESDEDEEVDVLDSDSDFVAEQEDAADDNVQPTKNSITQPVNNEPMETCVSPIPQTQDSVIIDSQATIFSDCSQELPYESVNLSQMSPASSPESEVMDTQESITSDLTTNCNKTFSPFKPLKPSPPKTVMQKLSKNILSPTPVTQLLTVPIKNSSKSPNQGKSTILFQPAQIISPGKTVQQKISPSPMRQLLTSPIQKSSKNLNRKNGDEQTDSSSENSNKKTVSKESENLVEPTKEAVSQKSNTSEETVDQISTNTATETVSQKSNTPEKTASQKPNAPEKTASQKPTNTATETASPISQKSKSPKRTVEPKKPVVGKSTIVPTQLLSRRKKFQPYVNIQRKKTLPQNTTSDPQKESEVMEDVELNNTSKERSISPRIGVIKSGTSTPRTESEKLQILCQSQPVSDNDDDDDEENGDVEIIDCDEFSDDGQPIMNIIKLEPGLEHTEKVNEHQCSVIEDEPVQELNVDVQNTDMDASEHVENTSENENIGDVVNTSCDEPSTSSGHDSVVSSLNTNTSIITSPNLTTGLKTVKNKSKTTPISQRYQKPNSESTATLSKDKIDLTKRIVLDSSVITEGSPHFVLPANVFPNLPFNQGEEKMQMVLVPETKDGETIYHVYMLPETDESKNTDSSKNSNTDKVVEPS